MSTETIGVVGMGYVGLPLSIALADSAYNVIGVDIDEDRVEQLRSGRSHVEDVSDTEIQERISDSLQVSTSYEHLSEVQAVALCVPTPLDKTQQPNLSYVVEAVESLAEVVPKGCTIILESTVYPGATREIVADLITENGFEVGEDVFVAHSPERIDPGNATYDLIEIPKVVGGVTPECGIRAQAVYECVFETVVPVESATEAELVKLLENTFRTVNIGLINELSMVANELGVNIWDTIEAAATKPFGFMPFYPGPGLGGHCLPIDPLYLSWKAGQQGIDIEFIELANEINRGMPRYVVEQIVTLLNQDGVPVPNAEVFVIGAAYKSNVSDVRESPAFDVFSLLSQRNANVQYYDPHVSEIELQERVYQPVASPVKAAAAADIVVILTDHDAVDTEAIVDAASLVFDTRYATDGARDYVHLL